MFHSAAILFAATVFFQIKIPAFQYFARQHVDSGELLTVVSAASAREPWLNAHGPRPQCTRPVAQSAMAVE